MVEDASSWTEHTHTDGRRYYYNRVTKQSSWDKPDALKSAAEKLNNTVWKEYKSADGRDYYFNTVTKQSVWDMPIELQKLRGAMKGGESSEDEEEEEKQEKEPEPEWTTMEERKNAFRDLLSDKGVKSAMKWEEALKLIQDDRRFYALSTAGERKQAFAEFATQSLKRQKEEEREKRKRAKDEMMECLQEWKEVTPTTRYRDCAEAFYEKDFWKLIEEGERDELFQDFMDEFEKKAKDERRKQRKEHVEKVKKIYDENAEITVYSRWRDVQDVLKENETFAWFSKLESLTSWEEWVQATERKEVEQRTRSRYRSERLARDGFRSLLKEHHAQGKLQLNSIWREFVQTISDEPRYTNLVCNPGSTPHDVFDDFVEELGEKYKQDRAQIKKMAKASGLVVTSSSTYEWFCDQLSREDGFGSIVELHKKMVFESLAQKAREQDEDAERNAKRNRKRFVELLQQTREVTADSTYSEAELLLGQLSAWDAVDEPTRRQCFDIFVDQLKIQSVSRRASSGGGGLREAHSGESEDEQRRKKEKKREKEGDREKDRGGKKRKHREEHDEPAAPPVREVEEKKSRKHDKRAHREDEVDEGHEHVDHDKSKKKKHKKHHDD